MSTWLRWAAASTSTIAAIAAIAAANDLPVVTQDADFEALETIGGPRIIRV